MQFLHTEFMIILATAILAFCIPFIFWYLNKNPRKKFEETPRFHHEANCASKSPSLKPQKQAEPMESTTVTIRVGKDKYSWEMPAPVTGAAVYGRLESELGLKGDGIRSITHGGKKVKPDTVITKKLIVNLAKKKPQVVSAPVVDNNTVSYNFDFSSYWPSLSSLFSFFGSSSVSDLPKSSEQQKCEHTLRTASGLLREASSMIERDAKEISQDPKKFRELLLRTSDLGQALSTLGSGLANEENSNEKLSNVTQKTADEMDDDLIDDLLAEIPEVEELNIEQSLLVSKATKAAKSAPGNGMMDIMSSLMKPPANDASGAAPAQNLLSMLMQNKQKGAEAPKSKGPSAWKKSVTPARATMYAKLFQRDTKSLRSSKLKLSPNYMLGSSNVDSKKLQALVKQQNKENSDFFTK